MQPSFIYVCFYNVSVRHGFWWWWCWWWLCTWVVWRTSKSFLCLVHLTSFPLLCTVQVQVFRSSSWNVSSRVSVYICHHGNKTCCSGGWASVCIRSLSLYISQSIEWASSAFTVNNNANDHVHHYNQIIIQLFTRHIWMSSVSCVRSNAVRVRVTNCTSQLPAASCELFSMFKCSSLFVRMSVKNHLSGTWLGFYKYF